MTGKSISIPALHQQFTGNAAQIDLASPEAAVYEFGRRLGNMATNFYPEYPHMPENKTVLAKLGLLLESMDQYCRAHDISEVQLQGPSMAFMGGLVTKARKALEKSGTPIDTKITYAKDNIPLMYMKPLQVPVQFPA